MKSTSRLYLDKLLRNNKKNIKGTVLNVGGGSKPYRYLTPKMINVDLFANNEVDIKADITSNFPLKENIFDTVICTQVLEHAKNPAKVIEEIYKTTKKDGILILSTPFLENYHADPKDYWRFTEDGLRILLKNKFKIIKIQPIGGRIIWFAGFMYMHKIIPRTIIRIANYLSFYLDKYEKNKKVWTCGFFIIAKKI